MGGFQDIVPGCVDQSLLAAGEIAPEQEYDSAAVSGEVADHGIGERFPAYLAVGSCHSGLDGKDCIQQKDSLLCPGCETSMVRDLKADVIMQLFIDVLQ